MQILIRKKKESFAFNFKYFAVYKQIAIFSDGKLKKNDKNKFFKKNSILSKSMSLYEMNKDIPNAFYFIKNHSVSSYEGDINCEIKIDNEYISTFKVEGFLVDDGLISLNFKCYASSVKELLFLAKHKIIADTLSEHKIVIYNRSNLKIRFTKTK